MTLFLCQWNDRTSLLVDDEDEARAVEVATDVADGEAPAKVTRLPPRFFAAEVGFESDFAEDDDGDDDEEEGEELWCVPLPHVDEALAKMHAADIDATNLPPAKANGLCGVEAEDDQDRVVTCELKDGHDGNHRAGELEWDT